MRGIGVVYARVWGESVDAPSGRVTIFDNAAPSRATSRVIDGLWLDGFLSETEVK